METSDFIQEALEKYLKVVVLPQFEGRYQIDHRWSGIMAMGSEKLPVVKEVAPNVFCAVRMSGMGVALAPVVARKISAQMTESL
jgi:glycine/D-amino acid oxidase-like deaminating enzyme